MTPTGASNPQSHEYAKGPNSPHSGGSNAVAEANEFAGDAAVAPGGVVGGHVDDEATKRGGGGWSARRPQGLSPVAGDSASVPTQQGLWRDEPAGSLWSGQGRRDGTEQGPVLVGEGWSVVLPVQHCELVTQHDDLEVLRASRAHSQARQRHEQPIQDATHGLPGCKRIMPGQRARPYFGHPHAAIAPSRTRSSSARAGRSVCRRRTVSWWRRTMISRSFECPERTAKRANEASNRYRMRDTGSQDASASCLVSAHDHISGTHTLSGPFRLPQSLLLHGTQSRERSGFDEIRRRCQLGPKRPDGASD